MNERTDCSTVILAAMADAAHPPSPAQPALQVLSQQAQPLDQALSQQAQPIEHAFQGMQIAQQLYLSEE